MTFFTRKGEALPCPISARSEDYSAGDLVTWDLGDNIGRGPQMEDVLLNWKITGHYRYFDPAH